MVASRCLHRRALPLVGALAVLAVGLGVAMPQRPAEAGPGEDRDGLRGAPPGQGWYGDAAYGEPNLVEQAQSYYFEVPRDGRNRLSGVFSLGLGRVSLDVAERGRLFQADVVLPDESLRPAFSAEGTGATAHVRLGLDGTENGSTLSLRGVRNRSQNTWRLAFDPSVPLDLNLELGVTEADLDFTGFSVERLSVVAGMARTRLAFQEPNRAVLDHFMIDAGAARFEATGLGHARFRNLVFRGGAGQFDLDFRGGPLPPGARADVSVGVARLRLRLPENQPVVLALPSSFMTRVRPPEGYVEQGNGTWHSPAVRDPARAFHLNVRAGMGVVQCDTH